MIGDPDVEDDPGNDALDMGMGFDTAVGGDGDDAVLGGKDIPASEDSKGHSNIHGGQGNESIDAGDGADLIFDHGGAGQWQVTEADQALDVYALKHDGEGNDVIRGSNGSGWITFLWRE